jgi:hypothetical protein
MTKRNILIALGFVLLTTACGKVTGVDGDSTGKVNPDQLQKATDQFCSPNQKLQELQDGTDVPFGQLNYRSRIFAFVGSDTSQNCIIKQSINKTFNDGTWFSINPIDGCLKNGSVWTVQSQSSGFGQYYSMTMIGDPNMRIMNMNGHQGLRGTYVSDNLGLKVLTCVNK